MGSLGIFLPQKINFASYKPIKQRKYGLVSRISQILRVEKLQKMSPKLVLLATLLLAISALSKPIPAPTELKNICNYRLFNNLFVHPRNFGFCTHQALRKRREIPERARRRVVPLKSYQTLEYNLVGNENDIDGNILRFGGVSQNAIPEEGIGKPLRCIGAIMMMAMCYWFLGRKLEAALLMWYLKEN